jgi:hypothetical protein
MFTTVGSGGYVAEKAEGETGWLFPVGDEVTELGYVHMFTDMLDALDQGTEPMETFYDGYVVNAVMDACYRSAETRQWEPVLLDVWRGATDVRVGVEDVAAQTDYDEQYSLIKQERMPDGRTKLILRDKGSGQIVQRIE